MSVNKFFNPFSDKKETKEEKPSELFQSKYIASHYQKISNIENDLVRVPTLDEFFFLQSDTAFNAFTFIPMVAKYLQH